MPFRESARDREFDKFIERPDGETAVRSFLVNTFDEPIPVSGGNTITSWTREVVSVTTTPLELTPIANQVFIRIVPLVEGNFYYGPDTGIGAGTAEVFSSAAPIEITISDSVFIVKDTGSGNVVVYRGSA